MCKHDKRTTTVANLNMSTSRLALPILLALSAMLASCTSSQQTTFSPEGDSPPIPMAASIDTVEKTAQYLAPPPISSGSIECDPGDQVGCGKRVSENNACGACHSLDGSSLVGPTWKGLFGRVEVMTDGLSLTVDDAYIIESIRNPKAKIVQGYADSMPEFDFLTDEEVNALVAYIKSIQ